MPGLNILYIHSHDTGRYIQPFGRSIPTPNLQHLAETGVLFRQAFSAAPVCSASRAALLTGQSPHAAGMIGLAHRGFQLNDYRQHLVQFLGAAGYHTALAGTQHEAPAPGDLIGYHQILPVASGRAGDIASAAVTFLTQSPQQPFFLSVGFSDTHREFPERDPRDDPRYLLPPAPLPDLPEVREDMAGFLASARALDDGVGQVLAALESAGLAENTLVIATTDHGIAFPGMKCTLTDHGLGVYLIMRGAEAFQGGRVIDAMVSHLDLYPTLCDLLGLPIPAWVRHAQAPGGGQGRSLLPLVRGEVQALHEALFGEVTYHAAYEPMRSVRTAHWKYIRRFDAPLGGFARRVLPNTDDSPSKTALLAHGWGEHPLAAEYLFDLSLDPNETNNLAGQAEHAADLVEMRLRLKAWMEATADPLLNGPVPAPPGALVNNPSGLSPKEEPHAL